MTIYHPGLVQGRWYQMRLLEQMANIGSEVERAFQWKGKNNPDRAMKAFERALELLDLTLQSPDNKGRLKEIARTRELFVDAFLGENRFGPSEQSLQKYFLEFACAARKNRK